MLLGSPPDMVHGFPLRRTGPLITAYMGQTIQTYSPWVWEFISCYSGLQVTGHRYLPG